MKITWPLMQSYKTQLFILLLVCFASAILGDSTAEALLLANYDSSIIPHMFLFNAAALFIVSSVMMILIDAVDRGTFFLTGLLVHGFMLFLFKIAVSFHILFVYPVLFTYAYISKILLFMLFWTLANDLVDSRKAGKEFPLIAAGGTLGAVMVSFSIPSILKFIPAEGLLLFWIALIVIAIVLFLPVKYHYGLSFKARSERTRRNIFSIVKDLDLFRQEPLLFNMGILYFLLFFLMLNQHFLFYTQLKNQFVTASGVASFLGYFNGVSMVSTFVLQMTVSGLVLRKFGSARSMLLVPSLFTLFFLCIFVSVLIGNTASVVFSCIVIAGMGLRIAFFDSFFSPNFQIFFSSLPQQIRGRGKLTMEGVIKPCAMVLSGIWLMWAGKQLSLTIQTAILFVVALLAIYQTWRIKNQYTRSLTSYLTGFSGIKASGSGVPAFNNSPEVLRRLCGKLYLEKDFEVKKFIIELIATSSLSEATRILVDHFKLSDARTRSFMLASIHGTNQKGLKDLVENALSDPDARVVANAVLALAEISGASLLIHIDALMKHPSPRVRANLIYSAWRFSDEGRKKVLLGQTFKILYEKFPEESSSALYALGGMDDEAPTQLLWEFVKFFKKNLHEYPSVFNQAVRALGKKRHIVSADLLLQLSQACTKKQRNEIVKALGSVMSNLTYEQLCALSFATDYSIFNLIVSANHVTGKLVDDAWHKHLINYAEREIQETITYMNKYHNLNYLHGKGAELLRFAILEEHIDVRIDTLVHIASLVDRSGHIRKILPRLFHSNAHMRARAMEVLDNCGDNKFNRSIMNILENRINFDKHKSDMNKVTGSEEHSITEFLADPNEWVAQCAQYCVFTQVRGTV